MKKTFILVFFLIILSGIGIVNAETLTGDLGTGEGWLSQTYSITSGSHGTTTGNMRYLYFNDIQNAQGFKSLIFWMYQPASVGYDSGSPNGAVTSFTAYNTNLTDGSKGSTVKGTGFMGYQRSYDYAGTQVGSYCWIIFDEPVVNSDTGDVKYYIEYDHSALYNITFQWYPLSSYTPASGFSGFALDGTTDAKNFEGTYTQNRDLQFHNSYTVTKPAGLGIQGSIIKSYLGTTYQSRAFIINASDGAVISSEASVNPITYNFTNNKEVIRICLLSSNATWFNSTDLFTAGSGYTPTPTPTVTATPIPTIAPGYIRTWMHLLDREGNHIHAGNIDIEDIEGSTWTNSTHDADGIAYIDTLPYHTINIYGSYDIFENEFLPNELLAQETGYTGYTYYLTLFPYESLAEEGQTSLYVEVKDAQTHSYISYAVVKAAVDGGYTYSQSTATAGSAVFLVPNNTIVRLSATASGYISGSSVINTGSGSSYTTTIELTRQLVTVTPTSTVPPGGVTPAITVDGRTANQKDADMMNKIRDNGPVLIDLAIIATILGLVGLMTKGWK